MNANEKKNNHITLEQFNTLAGSNYKPLTYSKRVHADQLDYFEDYKILDWKNALLNSCVDVYCEEACGAVG